jgi:hypothetical protein
MMHIVPNALTAPQVAPLLLICMQWQLLAPRTITIIIYLNAHGALSQM